MLRIDLLGPAKVSDNRGQVIEVDRPALTLLAVLASDFREHKREALAQLFYAASGLRQARTNISYWLMRLRRSLGEEAFERNYHNIKLRRTAFASVDIELFINDLQRIQVELSNTNQTAAHVRNWLDQTLALYRGEFMQDAFVPDSPELQDWLLVERERYRRAYLGWSEHLIQLCLAENAWDDAERAINRTRHHEPLDESIHALNLQRLAAQGQLGELRTTHERYRTSLITDMGVTPSKATESLFHRLSQKARNSYPSHRNTKLSSSAPLSNPPRRTDSGQFLLGREEITQRIARKLISASTRLVTITGLGGSGKTVLAQAVAAQLASAFQDGMQVVSMATIRPVNSATAMQQQVAQAIAAELGLDIEGDRTVRFTELVKAHVRDKNLLLVLDNCEPLLDAAPFFAELLQVAPQLRILATSRQRLNLSVESVEPISGLPVPTITVPSTALPGTLAFAASATDAPTLASELTELMGNAAVQLFVMRAQQVVPTFALTQDNASAIARICIAVGGMPLALALAAHWVTLFSVHEIAAAIDRQLSFLVTPYADLPERHRSLLVVFNQSWDHLTAPEQQALTALALFQHAFDRDAALAVAHCDLPVFSSLINHSMIEIRTHNDYALHPLLRTFIVEREIGSDWKERNKARQRFITHTLQRLIALSSNEDLDFSKNLHKISLADVSQAWEWAAEGLGASDTGNWITPLLGTAAPHFGSLWRNADQIHEGIRLLKLVLDRLEPKIDSKSQPEEHLPLLVGHLHHQLALLYVHNVDMEPALHHIRQAHLLLRRALTREALGYLLLDYGDIQLQMHQRDTALALLKEAADIGGAISNPNIQMTAAQLLSATYWAKGEWDRADLYSQNALQHAIQAKTINKRVFDVYWEVVNQTALSNRWDLARQTYQRLEDILADGLVSHALLIRKRQLQILLHLGTGQWQNALNLLQENLSNPLVRESRNQYCDVLSTAILVAWQCAPELAQTYTQEFTGLAGIDTTPDAIPNLHLVVGISAMQRGQIEEARQHFVSLLKLYLSKQKPEHGLNFFISGVFHLAYMERAHLPSGLFEEIIQYLGTHRGGGVLTHFRVRELLQSICTSQVGPANDQAYPPNAVNWHELQALATKLIEHIQGLALP